MKSYYSKNCKRIIPILAFSLAGHMAYSEIDVTSNYLINPSFEYEIDKESEKFNGWNVNFSVAGNLRPVKGSKLQVSLEAAAEVGFFEGKDAVEGWVSSANALSNFDFSQTVENLPAGTYRFSVGAKGLRQSTDMLYNDVVGLYLYANNDSVPISTPMVMVDGKLTNDLRNGNEPISQFFIVETTITEQSDIKFGFCAVNTDANWLCFDNFRMYLVSCDDMSFLYENQALDILNKYANEDMAVNILASCLNQLQYGGTLWDELDELKANINASDEDYSNFYAKVQSVAALAEDSRKHMSKMTDLIASAYILLEDKYPGANELEEAISNLELVYMDETLTIDGAKEAVSHFEDAILAYKVSNILGATVENPIDITYLIANPTIDEGTSSGNYTALKGWTCEQSGANGRYLYFNAEAGNVAFEAWNSNASTIVFDYHQEMRGLPTGIYTLKANARGSQGTPNGNAVVYATTTIEKTASIYNPVYLGIGENEDDMSEYVIDNIFVSDGTLRFGVKSVGVLDNKWTVADDFQLIYCGNENEALGYQIMMKSLVDEAKSYVGDNLKLLYADNQTLNAAIAVAEPFITSESKDEILAAIDDLQVAIDAAKIASVDVMTLKNGSYKTFVGYASETQDLVDVANAMVNAVNSKIAAEGTTLDDLLSLAESMDKLVLFYDEYATAVTEITTGGYSFELQAEYEEKVENILATLKDGDFAKIEVARVAIAEAVTSLRNSAITEGVSKDLTSWIINPGFELDAAVTTGAVTGWINDGMKVQNNASFGEKTGTYYCEKWVASGYIADGSISQSLIVPNGLYTISVDASATNGENTDVEGVYLFACNGGLENAKYRTNIINQYIVPAVNDTVIQPVLDGENNPVYGDNGEPLTETIITNVSPAQLTYSLQVAVDMGKITFGIESENATCGYLRYDNFKLTYDDVIPAGVEEVNKDVPFYAYVIGKQIYVSGVENYAIYSSNGQLVSVNSELSSGIYFVVANGVSVKVSVK